MQRPSTVNSARLHPPTINRAGFRRVNAKGETEFYVLPEAFKAELRAGQEDLYRSLGLPGLLLDASGTSGMSGTLFINGLGA
jgi:hypothetical protein